MCDACEEQKKPVRSFTRRAFMALAAGAAGGLTAGLWSCRQEPKRLPSPKGTLPATTASSATAPAATLPESSPATTRTATEAATGPTPDLGAVLFPDIHNQPLAAATDAPVLVIPRTDWTHAGPTLSQIRPMNGIARITVHHTAWEWEMDAWTRTANEVENIREFHSGTRAMDRHWADIAYHFVVDRAGRVWQARPLAYQGAHVKGHNEHNLGIVLLGNFEVQSPTAAQLVSLREFIGFARGLYTVPLSQVFTHGELGKTSCPGKQLQAYMNRARRAWAVAEGVAWTQPVRLDAAAPASE